MLAMYYMPGSNMPVDELLVPFRQYVPSKPLTYGRSGVTVMLRLHIL